jgi:hypothetical protein
LTDANVITPNSVRNTFVTSRAIGGIRAVVIRRPSAPSGGDPLSEEPHLPAPVVRPAEVLARQFRQLAGEAVSSPNSGKLPLGKT